jgi:hypothetical protein
MSIGSKYIKNAEGHFVCPHCEKVTEKQNTMYYHVKKNHTKDLPFQCKKCSDAPRFLQKSSYLHHLATIHPEDADTEEGENPYVGVSFTCPASECAHSTHTKANLLIHYARTHCKAWIPSFSKGSVCGGCKKEFNSSSAFLYHSISCLLSAAPADQASIISRIK